MDFLAYVFLETVYGLGALGFIAYLGAKVLSIILRVNTHPEIVGVLAFVLGLLTLPSVPLYRFEENAVERLESEGFEVFFTARSGDITLPPTLIWPPVTLVRAAAPDPSNIGTFAVISVSYFLDEPMVSLVDARCGERDIFVSRPDEEGVFRELSDAVEMSEAEFVAFCS